MNTTLNSFRSSVGANRFPVPALLVGALLAAPCVFTALRAGDVEKTIVFADVKPDAEVQYGAVVETWAGNSVKQDKAVFIPNKSSTNFTRADPTRTDLQDENTRTDGSSLAEIIKPSATVTFDPNVLSLADATIVAKSQTHRGVSQASVTLQITADAAKTITVRTGKKNTDVKQEVLANAVTATFKVSVSAESPDATKGDADKHHSADAWAGVNLPSAKTYVSAPLGGFRLLQQNKAVYTGAAETGTIPGKTPPKPVTLEDPFVFTLRDLTTGTSLVSQIMTERFTIVDADLLLDDTGIQLAVVKSDPFSSVSVTFSNETPWVTNPYHYGVTLNSAGLAIDGEVFPLSGWTITSTPTLLKASYSFDPAVLPFDSAMVEPPASLFTAGHEYSYDIASTDGAFALAAAPDEPRTAMLVAGAVLCLIALNSSLVRRGGRQCRLP